MKLRAVSTTTANSWPVEVIKQTEKMITFSVTGYYSSGQPFVVKRKIREDDRYSIDEEFLIIIEE